MAAKRLPACLVILTTLFASGACKSWGKFWDNATAVQDTVPLFTVGGTVTGLSGTLVLQNNGGDSLTLSGNGSFTFATALAAGSTYDVTVKTNPTSQVCTVDNNAGYLAANVTHIQVVCAGDTNWVQDAYLKASNNNGNDLFGYSVAISGTTIVVGAPSEDANQTVITNSDGTAFNDNSASNSGAAYVFIRNASGDWVQDAYLKPSNAEAGDNFGHSVAISGETIVVGAPYEQANETSITNTDGVASANNAATNVGAAYVFQRDSAGNWYQDAYLKASNAGANDNFGYAVAISGTTIVVGAPYEQANETSITNTDGVASANNAATDAGAAYVFRRDSAGNWYQDAYLKASNVEADEKFGLAVAISGNTIAVGAYFEDSSQNTITNINASASTDNSSAQSGAVYVFERDSAGNWYQDAYLKASNPELGDYFGRAVAISGSTIVVGAKLEDSGATTITNANGANGSGSVTYSGAAYVFERDTTGTFCTIPAGESSCWYQDAHLKVSNSAANNEFGNSVAISGTIIVVDAHYEDYNATSITNTDGSHGGATGSTNSGAVYVFKRNAAGDWIQDAHIKTSNRGGNDEFGFAVAVSGANIVAGAPKEASNSSAIDNNNGSASGNDLSADAGAAYVFKAF